MGYEWIGVALAVVAYVAVTAPAWRSLDAREFARGGKWWRN